MSARAIVAWRKSETAGGLVFGIATAVVLSLGAGVAYGSHAFVLTLAILAPVGIVTVVLAHAVVDRRARLPGLRRQVLLIGATAGLSLVAALALFIAFMFISPHDALLAGLLVGYAVALGAWAVRLLGSRAMEDIDAVRRTLSAVGAGRRDVRTGVEGRDEIAQVAADVDRMADMLDTEERARRRLIAAVSHDLRTPITALQLLAEAIDDGIVDERTRRQYAARMSTHVRSLSTLIDDMFELTRLESGDLAWSVEQVSLEMLVRETVEAMQPEAASRMVAVRARLAEDLAPARANPEKLQRVLFNLIQNAIRHTPADGAVTVLAEPGDGALLVAVEDTGTGVAPEDRERVFEPFYRGGSEEARTESGAGLGLAISRAIVQAHGGRIWLEDAKPTGLRVRFTVPVV